MQYFHLYETEDFIDLMNQMHGMIKEFNEQDMSREEVRVQRAMKEFVHNVDIATWKSVAEETEFDRLFFPV